MSFIVPPLTISDVICRLTSGHDELVLQSIRDNFKQHWFFTIKGPRPLYAGEAAWLLTVLQHVMFCEASPISKESRLSYEHYHSIYKDYANIAEEMLGFPVFDPDKCNLEHIGLAKSGSVKA